MQINPPTDSTTLNLLYFKSTPSVIPIINNQSPKLNQRNIVMIPYYKTKYNKQLMERKKSEIKERNLHLILSRHLYAKAQVWIPFVF